MRAQARLLPGGRRLHLGDGPIDLIIEAWGRGGQVRAAYDAATRRFATLLDELCAELLELRSAALPGGGRLRGPVARRMEAAVAPFARTTFITPMAAVAGAVAEEVLAAMVAAADLDRACVNNGGDIALHLGAGQRFAIGLVDRPDRPSLFASTTIGSADPVRGVATSGWRGRSFSLGIADAVTVLASTAAQADAAATTVANAVDLPGHPAVLRRPARDIQPDSDLGQRLVTRDVGPLRADDIEIALASGVAEAERLVRAGLVHAVALHLQGRTRTVGNSHVSSPASPTGPAFGRPMTSSGEGRGSMAGSLGPIPLRRLPPPPAGDDIGMSPPR